MRGRLLAVLLGGLAPLAFAAHPLTTEDPDTQGGGHHQIEANTDWARQSDDITRVGTVTYTYGAFDNLDVFLNAPLTFSTPAGMNDLSLGVKWRWQQSDTISFALKPELFVPTGDETKGLGNGRTSIALTGIIAYDAAPWRLLGNIAATVNRYELQADRDANRNVVWRASTSAWYSLGEKWKLLADAGIERNIDKASNSYPGFLLGGFMYSPTPDLDLDAAMRFSLRCGACANFPHSQVGVGLTVRF